MALGRVTTMSEDEVRAKIVHLSNNKYQLEGKEIYAPNFETAVSRFMEALRKES